MSAGRYGPCPKCFQEIKRVAKLQWEELGKKEDDLNRKYGSIPRTQYLTEVRKLEKEIAATVKLKDLNPYDSIPNDLQEYWGFDLYPESGTLLISYSAHCDVCDFDYEFVKEVNILESNSD